MLVLENAMKLTLKLMFLLKSVLTHGFNALASVFFSITTAFASFSVDSSPSGGCLNSAENFGAS